MAKPSTKHMMKGNLTLSSVAASTCDTAQLVTRRCSKLASHNIITILFGCCRGSVSKLRSISTIFRSDITVKSSSFSCKLSSWSQAMNTLPWPHTQKWRHSYSWDKGPRCSFPPSLPNYFLRLEGGLAKNRWVNVVPWAFCHSNHVLSKCDIIPCHGRWTLGKGKNSQLTHAKDLIHPCFAPAFCATALQSKPVWIRPSIRDLAGLLCLK